MEIVTVAPDEFDDDASLQHQDEVASTGHHRSLPTTGVDIWLVGPRRLCEPLGHALLRVPAATTPLDRRPRKRKRRQDKQETATVKQSCSQKNPQTRERCARRAARAKDARNNAQNDGKENNDTENDNDTADNNYGNDDTPCLDAISALKRHMERRRQEYDTVLAEELLHQARHVYMMERLSHRHPQGKPNFIVWVQEEEKELVTRPFVPQYMEHVVLNRCVQVVVKERTIGSDGGGGEERGGGGRRVSPPPQGHVNAHKTKKKKDEDESVLTPHLHCTYYYHHHDGSECNDHGLPIAAEPQLSQLAQQVWKRALWATTSREVSTDSAGSCGPSPLFSTLLLA